MVTDRARFSGLRVLAPVRSFPLLGLSLPPPLRSKQLCSLAMGSVPKSLNLLNRYLISNLISTFLRFVACYMNYEFDRVSITLATHFDAYYFGMMIYIFEL